jgi:hypothetical protein
LDEDLTDGLAGLYEGDGIACAGSRQKVPLKKGTARAAEGGLGQATTPITFAKAMVQN